MAGKIIADIIEAPVGRISLNVANVTVASINASGVFSSTGNLLINNSGSIGTASIVDAAVTQAKIGSGVSGTGPTFRVHKNALQTISNSTFTKVTLPTKSWDTNNFFDSTTNHRFQPTVAGYYQINGKLVFTSTQTVTRFIVSIRLNGSESNSFGRGFDVSNNQSFGIGNISELFFLNGSTDYVELWTFIASSGTISVASEDSNTSVLSGFLARAA